MLAPGAHIGTFEVLAPLGAGGMGQVAIKVLPAERHADPTCLSRLL